MVKRVIKMVMFLFILLVAAGIALHFLLPVEKLKGPLVAKIEENVNAHVQLDDLELALMPIPSVILKNLTLTSTEAPFEDKTLFKMGTASLSVDLKSLLSKKISLSLNLIQPTVYYRENLDKTNFATLLKDTSPSQSSSPFMERLEVTSVVVERGVFYKMEKGVIDDAAQPFLKNLDVDVSHFSLSQKAPQKISIKASALMQGASQEMGLEGDLQFDPAQKTYSTEALTLKIGETVFVSNFLFEQKDSGFHYTAKLKADALSFQTLAAFDASFEKSLPPDAQIKGDSNLTVEASGNQDSLQMTGALDLEKAKIVYGTYFKKGEQIPAKIQWSYYGPVQNLMSSGALKGKLSWQEAFVLEKYEPEKFQADFHLSGSQMILDQMDFQLFEGSLTGKGVIDFSKTPTWAFDFEAKQIDLNNLMTVVGGFQDVVGGKGDMKVSLKGVGREVSEMKKTATGDGNLSISSGKVSRINFAKEILGATLVDGLNNALKLTQGAQNAPKISLPRFALQTQETAFNSFVGGFKIENGFLVLPDLKILGETVSLNLGGKSSLDGDLDMKGTLLLSRQETDQWLGDFQGKSLLVDSEGKMLVPFNMTGSVLTPLLVPDMTALTDKLKGSVTGSVLQNVQQKAPDAVNSVKGAVGDAIKGVFQ